MAAQKVEFEVVVATNGAEKNIEKVTKLTEKQELQLKKVEALTKALELADLKLAKAQALVATTAEEQEKKLQAVSVAERQQISVTQQLNTAKEKAVIKTDEVSQSTGKANMTLLNMNRVVQDLPYGLMGVANNIDPLVESFQRLSKESGGAGGALKDMAKGLIGPVGIGIAISATTSIMIKYGDAIQRYLTKSMVDASVAGKEYLKVFNEISGGFNKSFGLTGLAAAESDLELIKKQMQEIAQIPVKESAAIVGRDNQKAVPATRGVTGEITGLDTSLTEEQRKNANVIQEIYNNLKKQELQLNSEIAALKVSGTSKSLAEVRAEEQRLALLNEQVKVNSAIADSQYQKSVETIDSEMALIEAQSERFMIEQARIPEADAFYAKEKANQEETEDYYKTLNELEDSLATVTLESEKAMTEANDIHTQRLIENIDVVDAERRKSANAEIGNQKQIEAAQLAAQKTMAAAIGNTVAQSIAAGESMANVGRALVAQTLTEVIALAIKGAFIANPVFGAFIAPIAAAGAVATFNALVPKFARGTVDFAGGTVLVGEQGPEMVQLPSGSNVVSNENTRAILNNETGVNLNAGAGVSQGAMLAEALRGLKLETETIDRGSDLLRRTRLALSEESTFGGKGYF